MTQTSPKHQSKQSHKAQHEGLGKHGKKSSSGNAGGRAKSNLATFLAAGLVIIAVVLIGLWAVWAFF